MSSIDTYSTTKDLVFDEFVASYRSDELQFKVFFRSCFFFYPLDYPDINGKGKVLLDDFEALGNGKGKVFMDDFEAVGNGKDMVVFDALKDVGTCKDKVLLDDSKDGLISTKVDGE
ncbi:hypothetical protein Tco_0394014 [Tanacetum coccineum]